MNFQFSDQIHIDRIREALWRGREFGQAAVMIGAGFSLNAKPLTDSVTSFPTWDSLTQKLIDHLYPLSDRRQESRRQRALSQSTSASGTLRLSQEYEAAYGRLALDNLIVSAIPDSSFEPGDLHTLLLQLPWSDVFTTNWDTLLERGAANLYDRNYDTVRTVSELPRSTRPRVVKLHGSLPSNMPFIITEEDFRKYPVNFAPFVNLVQQSMMENIFCLLGFSGDDPNFLYWSGWVRDNLGPATPKIYLCGLLDLSSARRKMLQDRNVIPIDLTDLATNLDCPPSMRYRYALEWFLRNLEAGRPYDKINWPSRHDTTAYEAFKYLPEIPVAASVHPLQETPYPKNEP